MKQYNTLSEYLKKYFGHKVAKISLDAGFSCPNRENGGRGCLFCTDSGGSEFSGKRDNSITYQINEGIKRIGDKWKPGGYIAYFQNFSNTYADIDTLKKRYDEAITHKSISGIAIATRPDCFSDSIFNLLEEYNNKSFLWVELGFQTKCENTAELIERGYSNIAFENTINELNKRGIKTVVHIIAGLPGEGKEHLIETVKYLNVFRPWGIKIHNLYIQKNSRLYDYSINNELKVLGMNEYIDLVTEAIMHLNKDIVIHRLTGDPDKSKLAEPFWVCHKLKVLSEIDRVLKEKNGYQGIYNTNQSR